MQSSAGNHNGNYTGVHRARPFPYRNALRRGSTKYGHIEMVLEERLDNVCQDKLDSFQYGEDVLTRAGGFKAK